MKKLFYIIFVLLFYTSSYAGMLIGSGIEAVAPGGAAVIWYGADTNLDVFDATDGGTLTRTGVTYDGSLGASVDTGDACNYNGSDTNNYNLEQGTIKFTLNRPTGVAIDSFAVIYAIGSDSETLTVRFASSSMDSDIRFTYAGNRWVMDTTGVMSAADTDYVIVLNYNRGADTISATINGVAAAGAWDPTDGFPGAIPTPTGGDVYLGNQAGVYYLRAWLRDVEIYNTSGQ